MHSRSTQNFEFGHFTLYLYTEQQRNVPTCIKPQLDERVFACDGDAIFWKIVPSPARGENRMCSHPRTGDATDEKIAEKNREKFNELNFLRQNHGLCQRVAMLWFNSIFGSIFIFLCLCV